MKNNILALFILVVASIIISWPLTKPGLHQIHDDQQVARLYLFDQSLKSGQFPPRWVNELGFGYGYPLFVFYPPLVYVVGEAYHLLGFGFIDSVKLVFFTGVLASALALYVFASSLYGKKAAVVASLFYIFVPYRALDVYVRGALAESFAFIWLPLILWSNLKLIKTQKPVFIYLSAIFLALLMITHNLIFLPFMLILPFYLLFLIWKSNDKKISILHTLYSILLGFSLSAFFWIPALAEKKFTIVDQLLLVNLADYRIHFVALSQLWNWPWGFGGSTAGLADGISFKIGKLHILVSIAVFALIIIRLTSSKSKTIILFFVLFLLSAFMTTSYSSSIWQLIPPLGYLQFPWRFLTFTALFSSILAGAFVYTLRLPIFKLMAAIILTIALIIPNYKLFKPQASRTNLSDETATSKETINWYVSQSSFEYVPNGFPLTKGELGTNVPDIKTEDVPSQKVVIVDGEATIGNLASDPRKTIFDIDVRKRAKITANVFNFPGWKLTVDGKEQQISENKFKLISFDVPEGRHSTRIEFENTQVRTMANLISLISILLVISIVINILVKKPPLRTRFEIFRS